MRSIKASLGAFVFFAINATAQETNTLLNSASVIEEGVKLHQEGKYDEAIACYDRIARNDTNYVLALYEKAYTYEADSQFTKALAYCEEGLSIKHDRSREPLFLNLYGILLDDMEDYDRAMKAYDSALALYPAYTYLYINKGNLLNKLKQYGKAEKFLQQAILRDPYCTGCHFQLAVSALKQGKVVPAALALTTSLFISPEGNYAGRSIGLLSSISKNEDAIVEAVNKREDYPIENFAVIEQIIASKIALDKQYKVLMSLDDEISRQLQVLCEKLEFDPSEKDFYMQYYVPFYQKAFADGKFEPMVFQSFAGVNLPSIKSYHQKNKKEIKSVVQDAVNYFNLIRMTRELQPSKRSEVGNNYFFQDGNLFSHGYRNGEAYSGEWTYYFPAGNIKAHGNFNQNSEKDGTWNYYYFNGNIDGVERIKDGKLEGTSVYYYENGVKMLEGTYKNGKREGKFVRYYNTGALNTIEHYKEGNLEGERKIYFRSGELNGVEHYKDGLLEGKFVEYFRNGRKEKTGVCTKGKLNGPYFVYHENGNLSIEATYRDGKAEGVIKRYHPNGKLRNIEHYVNDESNGDYEEYYPNGQLITKFVTKKGKSDGDASYYDKDGKLYSTILYDNSRIKKVAYFDKAGNPVSTAEAKNRKIDFTAYSPEGFKVSHTFYDEKGEIDGIRSFYYTSGTLKETSAYKAGVLDGPSVGYHPNKNKSYEITYSDGSKDGYYKSYYKHGVVRQEGWYKNDLGQGTWIDYDINGKVTTKTDFLNDDIHGSITNYWPNGKLKSSSHYREGILDSYIQYDTLGAELSRTNFINGSGKFVIYYVNGKRSFEAKYVNNFLEGKATSYYYDGTVSQLSFYKGGLLDSIYREYYLNGKPQVEGQYARGEKTGTWKYYRDNGTLSSVSHFKYGEAEGTFVYYYENGKVETEISYKGDERDGYYKKYDESGELAYQLRYEAGERKGYTYFDKNRQLVPEIPIKGGNAKVETFFANGNRSAKFEYADDVLNHEDNLYYPNGKPKMLSTEAYGDTEGEVKTYYPDGTLKSVHNYLHNELNGRFTEYLEKGKVVKEGFYVNDMLHGPLKHYTADGKPGAVHIYYYGQLLEVRK